jgi:hypothetical protein
MEYKLTIKNDQVTIDDSGKAKLTKTAGDLLELKGLNTATKYDKSYSISLSQLEVTKEVYAPGYVKAWILVTKPEVTTNADKATSTNKNADGATSTKNAAISISEAKKFKNFLGHRISLTMDKEDIAKNYIIFDVQPQLQPDSNGNSCLYILLHIYSPDYLLVLKKFSTCYTAKKIGEEIIPDLLAKYAVKDTDNDVADATGLFNYKADADDLQQLSADLTYLTDKTLRAKTKEVEDKDGKKGTIKVVKKYELIHPYLVQNDETAHDFISRTANRCGEFFFYENGKLIFGRGVSDKATVKITNYSELSFMDSTRFEFDKSAYYEHSYKESANTYSATPASAYTGPTVDFFDSYQEQVADGPGTRAWKSVVENGISFKYKKIGDLITWINLFKHWLEKDSVADMITSVGMDIATSAVYAALNDSSDEKKFNDDFVDKQVKDETYTVKKAKDKDKNNNEVWKIAQFANINSKLAQNSFYVDIRKQEEESERESISVVLKGGDLQPLMLGSVITVDDIQNYMVTGVTVHILPESDGQISMSEEITAVVETELTGQYTDPITGKACTFTYTKDTKNEKGESVNETVTTSPKGYTEKTAVPMPITDRESKTASPQVAYVTYNDDPCKRGRIRVRYPWQSSKESTPWIRVATPYSSTKSGIKFMPQIGDEVMIDYEFGNIERPFMSASIQTQTNDDNIKESYSITSPNGHQITFDNPKNGKKFAQSFTPFMGAWAKVSANPATADCMKTLADKSWGGGITMTDKNGVYKISMSTDKRSVSIESSLGNVKISALTGITIDAPNGDIKIKGKNVEISAGNTLKLTSGTNIKSQKYLIKQRTDKKFMDDWGADLVASFITQAKKEILKNVQFIDLSLLRTAYEAFWKPVKGTMTIKSNRYMQLEAGKGSTTYPTRKKTTERETAAEKKQGISGRFYVSMAIAQKTLAVIENNLADNDKKARNYKKTIEDNIGILKENVAGVQKIGDTANPDSAKIGEVLSLAKLCDDLSKKKTTFKGIVDGITFKSTGVDPAIIQAAKEAKKALSENVTSITNLFNAYFETVDKYGLIKSQAIVDLFKPIDSTVKDTDLIVQDIRCRVENALAAWLANKGLDNKTLLKNRLNLNADDDENLTKLFPRTNDKLSIASADKRKLFYLLIQEWLTRKSELPESTTGVVVNSDEVKAGVVCIGLSNNEKSCIVYKEHSKKGQVLSGWRKGTWDKNPSTKKIQVCDDDKEWKNYLSCIVYNEQKSKGDKRLTGIKEVLNIFSTGFGDVFSDYRENYVWSPESEGEILISDSEGNTCTITGNTIKAKRNDWMSDAKSQAK